MALEVIKLDFGKRKKEFQLTHRFELLFIVGFGANPTPGAFGAQPAATTGAFGQPAQQSAFGAAPAAGKKQ